MDAYGSSSTSPAAWAAARLKRLQRIPGAGYWAAAGLVLISVAVRLLLSPVLGGVDKEDSQITC